MLAQGMKVDAVLMDEFRRSNAAEHARRIKAIQAAQAERDKAESLALEKAQNEAQKEALKPGAPPAPRR
jgi:RPA family protein